MKYVIALLTALVCLTNCENYNPGKKVLADTDSLQAVHADSLPTDSIFGECYIDSTAKYKIAIPGQCHSGEFWAGGVEEPWIGLFINKQGKHYLQPTKISVKRVYDMIMDNDNEATGWEISTDNPDSCLFLLSGDGFLKNGFVKPVALPIDTFFNDYPIWPNKDFEFEFSGLSYRLHSKGDTVAVSEGWTELKNYSLFLSESNGATKKTQEIVSYETMNENICRVIFIGDLDGDKKPDFIFNLTNDYNAWNYTVFLSKGANPSDIVTKVAEQILTGC